MLYRAVLKNKLVHVSVTLILHVCVFEDFDKITKNSILAILLLELCILFKAFAI